MAEREIPYPPPFRLRRRGAVLLMLFVFGLISIRLRHRTWAYSAERAALVTLAFLILFLLMEIGARLGLRRLRRQQDERRGHVFPRVLAGLRPEISVERFYAALEPGSVMS